MNGISHIFINKKILIYGLGKSGISASKFLKKKIKLFYLMIIKKTCLIEIKSLRQILMQ